MHVGRLVELEVRRTPSRSAGEMCEQLLANPLIEDYEILVRGAAEVRRHPLPRLLRRGRRPARLPPLRRDAELLWHGDRDLRGVDAIVVPGRLLLRRLPARRRDRPLLARDGGGARVRARRRPGARHLQRLPGALRGGPAPGRAAAQRRAALRLPPGRARSSRTRRTPFTRAAARRASCCRSRSSTPPAATTRPSLRSTSWRPSGQVVLRYADGQNPNGSAARHRRRRQQAEERGRA